MKRLSWTAWSMLAITSAGIAGSVVTAALNLISAMVGFIVGTLIVMGITILQLEEELTPSKQKDFKELFHQPQDGSVAHFEVYSEFHQPEDEPTTVDVAKVPTTTEPIPEPTTIPAAMFRFKIRRSETVGAVFDTMTKLLAPDFIEGGIDLARQEAVIYLKLPTWDASRGKQIKLEVHEKVDRALREATQRLLGTAFPRYWVMAPELLTVEMRPEPLG